jgi:hypothetical protein
VEDEAMAKTWKTRGEDDGVRRTLPAEMAAQRIKKRRAFNHRVPIVHTSRADHTLTAPRDPSAPSHVSLFQPMRSIAL